MEIACFFQAAHYSSTDATLRIKAQEVVTRLEKGMKGCSSMLVEAQDKSIMDDSQEGESLQQCYCKLSQSVLSALRSFIMQATS